MYCLHQELDSDDLLSLYETADCVLATPIKEGMNTVPFEYLVGSRAPVDGSHTY